MLLDMLNNFLSIEQGGESGTPDVVGLVVDSGSSDTLGDSSLVW
jgi:hypothetical protein